MTTLLKTKAIVVNSIRWKESSKIVTVYSEEFGRIKLIARGALRKGNSLAGKIETFFLIEAVLDIKKNRTLNLIKEADVLDTYPEIRLNMKLFPFGFSLIEILNQVLDETHPDPIFFNFVLVMLNTLKISKSPEVILIYFLLKLSSYLGFKPFLEKCESGDVNQCSSKVLLSMSNGRVSCKNCASNSIHPIAMDRGQFFFLKSLQQVNHHRIKNHEKFRSDSFQIINIILRYINFHLDKEIKVKSLQLLD